MNEINKSLLVFSILMLLFSCTESNKFEVIGEVYKETGAKDVRINFAFVNKNQQIDRIVKINQDNKEFSFFIPNSGEFSVFASLDSGKIIDDLKLSISDKGYTINTETETTFNVGNIYIVSALQVDIPDEVSIDNMFVSWADVTFADFYIVKLVQEKDVKLEVFGLFDNKIRLTDFLEEKKIKSGFTFEELRMKGPIVHKSGTINSGATVISVSAIDYSTQDNKYYFVTRSSLEVELE